MRNAVLRIGMALAFFPIVARAGSYEGYLASIPIWMDLNLPDRDGPVSGTYFYKKVGAPITLTGDLKEGRVSLREKDGKGKVTGRFALDWDEEDKTLFGEWTKPSGKGESEIRLWATDSVYRKHAVHPFSELKMAGGGTLKEELANRDFLTRDPVSFTYDRKNILSLGLGYTLYIEPANPDRPELQYDYVLTERHLFDLTRKTEIDFHNEMDPAGRERLWKALRPRYAAALKEVRARKPDSAWREEVVWMREKGLDMSDPERMVDLVFSPGECDSSLACFDTPYLTADSIRFPIEGGRLFTYPPHHQEEEVFLETAMPFTELLPCLKPESILRNLGKKP